MDGKPAKLSEGKTEVLCGWCSKNQLIFFNCSLLRDCCRGYVEEHYSNQGRMWQGVLARKCWVKAIDIVKIKVCRPGDVINMDSQGEVALQDDNQI